MKAVHLLAVPPPMSREEFHYRFPEFQDRVGDVTAVDGHFEPKWYRFEEITEELNFAKWVGNGLPVQTLGSMRGIKGICRVYDTAVVAAREIIVDKINSFYSLHRFSTNCSVKKRESVIAVFDAVSDAGEGLTELLHEAGERRKDKPCKGPLFPFILYQPTHRSEWCEFIGILMETDVFRAIKDEDYIGVIEGEKKRYIVFSRFLIVRDITIDASKPRSCLLYAIGYD